MIRNQYASLGIESEKLAYSIARICNFHDIPP
jgi:hypothetical protein